MQLPILRRLSSPMTRRRQKPLPCLMTLGVELTLLNDDGRVFGFQVITSNGVDTSDLNILPIDLISHHRGSLGLFSQLLVSGSNGLAKSETIINLDFLPGTGE